MYAVYELGQDTGNYQVSQSGDHYAFTLHNADGDVIAESRPGADYDATEVSVLIQSLVRFFKGIANPSLGIAVTTGPQGDPCAYDNDPYSFRISVILPGWTERFADPNFRQFAERVIREEAPAHVHARICWISRFAMKDLETCYADWLQANAQFLTDPNSNHQASEKLQALVQKLAGLKNYYMARSVLHDCTGEGNSSAIILDNSILGNS